MPAADQQRPSTRKEEIAAFLTLTFIVAPAVTIGGVGLLGLSIWLTQTFVTGPPSG